MAIMGLHNCLVSFSGPWAPGPWVFGILICLHCSFILRSNNVSSQRPVFTPKSWSCIQDSNWIGEPSTDCVVEKRSISARKQRPQKRWPLTLAKNTTPSSSCNKIIMRGAGLTYCDCQTVRQSKARASWQPRCYITSCLANMPSTPQSQLRHWITTLPFGSVRVVSDIVDSLRGFHNLHTSWWNLKSH